MPDYEDASVASSVTALEPLLRSFREALLESGLRGKKMDELFFTAAEIYALAYRDGVRHAVGEIAPEAERHGLGLWLSPELEDLRPKRSIRGRRPLAGGERFAHGLATTWPPVSCEPLNVATSDEDGSCGVRGGPPLNFTQVAPCNEHPDALGADAQEPRCNRQRDQAVVGARSGRRHGPGRARNPRDETRCVS